MTDYFFKKNEIIEVDLHKMSVIEAEPYLNRQINIAPSDIKEIVVIHGYHSGTALLNMVRNKFYNPRIKHKFKSLNQGITYFILR